MHTKGHTTVWEPQIDVNRARDPRHWSQQLRDWWTAHQAARQQARLEALHRCWDATREVVTPFRAEAAPDMAMAHRSLSGAIMRYELS